MSELLQHGIAVFLGFFAIMNPIANTAAFVGLTAGDSAREQRRVAIKALLIAITIVVAFSLLGKAIFDLFGITLPALQITGGVLVFLIGYQMLHGETSELHQAQKSAGKDIAVSPLAIPLLSGPGTIATAMNYSAAGGWEEAAITILSFVVLSIVTFFCFIFGQSLVKILGDSGMSIVTRLMGLILAVIGTQMLIDGIAGASIL